jgi:hypothetical protein
MTNRRSVQWNYREFSHYLAFFLDKQIDIRYLVYQIRNTNAMAYDTSGRENQDTIQSKSAGL